MKYSIIVAVYNRPEELKELLQSLCLQTYTEFEVIIVEDGSTVSSRDVCQEFSSALRLRYFVKENTGPGLSRNYGCRRASGDYFLFIDSDCTVPPTYMSSVDEAVTRDRLDSFGGPDREDVSFTPVQKAINYAMTSFLTTGGIRGRTVRVGGTYHPRSFNMGLSREVFNTTDGFSRMRFGEDVDLSIRIAAAGFRAALIPDAYVYHKRRTDYSKFFKQVHNSGIARVNLTLRHPGTLKLTHFFPAAFTTYVVAYILNVLVFPPAWPAGLPGLLYLLAIAVEGTLHYRSVAIGIRCVVASVVMLIAYGTGFARGIVLRIILGKPEQGAFEKTLYT